MILKWCKQVKFLEIWEDTVKVEVLVQTFGIIKSRDCCYGETEKILWLLVKETNHEFSKMTLVLSNCNTLGNIKTVVIFIFFSSSVNSIYNINWIEQIKFIAIFIIIFFSYRANISNFFNTSATLMDPITNNKTGLLANSTMNCLFLGDSISKIL